MARRKLPNALFFLRAAPICVLLGAALPAHAFYGNYSYGGYSGYYSRQQQPPISLDLDPQHLTDSSFRIAAREDRLDDMFQALRQGANVNSASDEGTTALMYAARNCSTKVVQELLAHRADINIRDREGDTALIYATLESCVPVVKLLLASPDVHLFVRDHEGRDVFDYAKDCAEIDVDGPATEILRLLLRRVPHPPAHPAHHVPKHRLERPAERPVERPAE